MKTLIVMNANFTATTNAKSTAYQNQNIAGAVMAFVARTIARAAVHQTFVVVC